VEKKSKISSAIKIAAAIAFNLLLGLGVMQGECRADEEIFAGAGHGTDRTITMAWDEALHRAGLGGRPDGIEMPRIIWQMPKGDWTANGSAAPSGRYSITADVIEAADYDVLVHEMIHAIICKTKGVDEDRSKQANAKFGKLSPKRKK
jgi:hypothetical protein